MMVTKKKYHKRSAEIADVRRAIKEDRIRVEKDGRIFTRGPWPKSKWISASAEHVNAPGRSSKYARVYFSDSTGQLRCLVHRLMWFVFHGEISEGFEIDHLNGNKLDNRLSNLDLVTPKENSRRAIDRGLFDPHAPKNGIVEWSDVLLIRKRYANGERQSDLAREFGLSANTINNIVHEYFYKREPIKRRRRS